MTNSYDIVFIPKRGWFIIEVNSEELVEGPFASQAKANAQLEHEPDEDEPVCRVCGAIGHRWQRCGANL